MHIHIWKGEKRKDARWSGGLKKDCGSAFDRARMKSSAAAPRERAPVVRGGRRKQVGLHRKESNLREWLIEARGEGRGLLWFQKRLRLLLPPPQLSRKIDVYH